MAEVILAAMYSAEAPPSYLEKAAIHHLFSAYTVFHKGDGLTDWQQQVLPGKKERLQQFIEKTYVEFEPGQDLAVSPDQKLVVKRRQLDDVGNIAALNGIFQLDQPQPEMVLDFEGNETVAELSNRLHVPTQVTKLAIINSGGSVTAIGGGFLGLCQSLEALTLSLPQVTQVGDGFLVLCQSLTTLTLNLPQVKWVGGWFLYGNKSLTTLTLNLPQLTQVGGFFLHCNQSLNTLTLNLPQLTQVEEGFLYKNQSLETLTLSLPQLTQVGGWFLSECQSLKTLTMLSLPQLIRVGGGFLFKCLQLKSVDLRSLLKLEKVEVDYFMGGMHNLEHVLIDARQEEFFKELLKDKPDLLPKLVIAA